VVFSKCFSTHIMKRTPHWFTTASLALAMLGAGSVSSRADVTDDVLAVGMKLGFPNLVKESGAPIHPGEPLWDEYFAKMRDVLLHEHHVLGSHLKPFNMPSHAMLPTLQAGDEFIVYHRYYADHDPQRGEVALFQRDGDNAPFVKRIIGLPGDKVEMKAGRLWINGEMAERQFLGATPKGGGFEAVDTANEYLETLPGGVKYRITEYADDGPLDDAGPFQVPADEYFVLGDNRDNSRDSRLPDFGYIPRAAFTDRPDVVYMSPDLQQIGAKIQP
jgi:signal peptidase I